MDNSAYISLPELALVGAVMILLPHFSPRGYCFGITVSPEFRASEIEGVAEADSLRDEPSRVAGIAVEAALFGALK